MSADRVNTYPSDTLQSARLARCLQHGRQTRKCKHHNPIPFAARCEEARALLSIGDGGIGEGDEGGLEEGSGLRGIGGKQHREQPETPAVRLPLNRLGHHAAQILLIACMSSALRKTDILCSNCTYNSLLGSILLRLLFKLVKQAWQAALLEMTFASASNHALQSLSLSSMCEHLEVTKRGTQHCFSKQAEKPRATDQTTATTDPQS